MRRSDEGVLLRKKQEQWAKEKEELAADRWFPFGSPGGGNPNKKHVARDYEAVVKSPAPYARPATENVPPPQDPSTSTRQLDTVATTQSMDEGAGLSTTASYPAAPGPVPLPYMAHPMLYGGPVAAASSSVQYMDYMQQFHYAPMSAYPAYAYGGGAGGVPEGAAGYPPFPHPHYAAQPHHMIVLPAGTIPIPVPPPPPSAQQQCMMSSSYSSERWVADWTNPHHMTNSGGTTIEEMPEDAESTVGGPSTDHPVNTTATTTLCTMQNPQQFEREQAPPPFTQPRDVPHAYVSPFVSAVGGGGGGGKASEERSEDEYDVYKAQIVERQRLEAEQEERERREEERIERVRREREEARRREEQKREEEERKREEDREKSAQAVLEAMERARKEAELLKKMRLHRHTLEAADGDATLPIDGVDRRRVEEMKREVDAFERQKRLEAEEIARNAPPKEKKGANRGMSLSRSPSIAAHYESAVESSARSSRQGAPAPSTPSSGSSPFRRAASLAPASAAARRSQQQAAAASATVASPPLRPPLATSTPQKQLPKQQPFERDAKARFSLRGTPSPQGVTSRYAHLNQPSPIAPPRVSTASTRSPSVGRPPIAPPRGTQKTAANFTPSMPSRDSPLSRTFHAGDKTPTRQSMKENARSSGYGIGGSWLYSYSPSASRSATPDRLGWSSSGRSEVTPDETRRGREDERGRPQQRDWREDSWEDGGSSPRSNETFITSPTVTTATSRVDEPRIRYSVPPPREEEYGEEYSSRQRSSSVRPSSRQEEADEYGRRSHIPVPLPRTRLASTPLASASSSITNPLFSPISTRARKMRISSKDTPAYRRENSMESSVTSNDSGASSGSEGGTTEGIRKITAKERVVPAIQVDHSAEETDEMPVKMFTPRFSSRPSTPDRVNGALRHYSERVREMGTAVTADRLREPLTPTVQPRASTLEPTGSSSLSASLRSLRMSINNLNLAGLGSDSSSSESSAAGGRPPAPLAAAPSSLGASPLTESPSLTRFHSRTSQYRSFNTKRGTEKQQQLLDRLVSLRSRLQDTQSYKERPLSRQGSTLSMAGAGISRLGASP